MASTGHARSWLTQAKTGTPDPPILDGGSSSKEMQMPSARIIDQATDPRAEQG
jgi:hypothetical protein